MYVKCAQCGRLYQGSHLKCPYDQCERITRRIFWNGSDYEQEKTLIEQDRAKEGLKG